MQTKITARHGHLSDETREFLTHKCDKLLHIFERVTEIHTTVDFQHNSDRVRVELLVDAEHKHDFAAHSEGDTVTHAFEAALHKMETQLRRYKKKIQNHRGDPSARMLAADPFPESDPSVPVAEDGVAGNGLAEDSVADAPAAA